MEYITLLSDSCIVVVVARYLQKLTHANSRACYLLFYRYSFRFSSMSRYRRHKGKSGLPLHRYDGGDSDIAQSWKSRWDWMIVTQIPHPSADVFWSDPISWRPYPVCNLATKARGTL